MWRADMRVLIALAVFASTGNAQLPIDTLVRRHPSTNNSIAPRMGKLCTIGVPRDFRYIGGRRFMLQGTADAEQVFYVKADSSFTVRELFWFQVEQGIPGKSAGYTYARDSLRTVNGLPWRLDLRSNRGAPPVGSDGAAMLAYVERAGYRLAPMGPRLRMVYLPEPGGLQEFMIIYLTSIDVAGRDTTFEGTIRRAASRLQVQRCR